MLREKYSEAESWTVASEEEAEVTQTGLRPNSSVMSETYE